VGVAFYVPAGAPATARDEWRDVEIEVDELVEGRERVWGAAERQGDELRVVVLGGEAQRVERDQRVIEGDNILEAVEGELARIDEGGDQIGALGDGSREGGRVERIEQVRGEEAQSLQ
jgi:hypothetical protein